MALDAGVHNAACNHPLLAGGGDAPRGTHGVNRTQVVRASMARLDATAEVDAV